jgi:hypothetical protein
MWNPASAIEFIVMAAENPDHWRSHEKDTYRFFNPSGEESERRAHEHYKWRGICNLGSCKRPSIR